MLLRHLPNTETSTDPRAAELRELAAAGITLPMPIDMILWYEDRGYIVDMQTGLATLPSAVTPTPSGRAVAYLLADDAPPALVAALDPEIDALLDEVYGKPGLGIDDSAGIYDLFDYSGELDDLIEGRLDEEDWARGC